MGDSEHEPAGEHALTLRPDPAAVSVARRFVGDVCARAGLPEDVADAAVLLTSELVTNAFIHGRSDARVRVRPGAGCARIEVADDNSRHPQAVEEDVDALDGRGLAIVELVAQKWGVRDDPYGKTVWFVVGQAA